MRLHAARYELPHKYNLTVVCSQSVARAGQAAKVQEAIENLPAGECMGISYASKIDSTQPWITHFAQGSCDTELEQSMRELYAECAQISTKVRRPVPLFPCPADCSA